MTRTVAGVSSAAVEEATGRDWAAWVHYLDGCVDPSDHPSIVAAVRNAGVENPWWQQTVAVGFEQERGGRQVGQTADAGFQLGVQRTIHVQPSTLWDYLTGEGVDVWLGDTETPFPRPDTRYRTTDGTTGEVRTVTEGDRLRLTWHPARLAEPAVLQVTLACPRNTTDRTTLRFHLEQLPDARVREELKPHWQAILDRVQRDLEA